ncbi:MAG TPA: hypothetical protein VGR71_18390 [Nitrospira sp.]|nr:hypothetical protein [Nitrospira sp.]
MHTTEESLSPEPDKRFGMWVNRYIKGDWNVENGSLSQIGEELKQLNALLNCTVGAPLFDSADASVLSFPTAQNNHRYHDAHSGAYKLLIDGLNKNALKLLASKLSIVLRNPDSEKTLKVLEQLLPEILRAKVLEPFKIISKNRRSTDHGSPPAAEFMLAFEQFMITLT